MDETYAVLARLERIERLQAEGALAVTLLDELRALLREAEEWARLEGGDAGRRAVAELKSALSPELASV